VCSDLVVECQSLFGVVTLLLYSVWLSGKRWCSRACAGAGVSEAVELEDVKTFIVFDTLVMNGHRTPR